jgi:hypothetical protein
MKTLGWFLLRFGILFGLLAWPWPVLHPIISAGFRAEVRLLVGARLPSRAFHVQSYSDPAHPTLDTVVVLSDRKTANPTGGKSSVGLPLDSASQCWIPLAMAMALILATPLPWRNRLKALVVGVLSIQVLIAISILVGVSVVQEGGNSPGIALVMANHLLNENIWFSFVPPFLFWAAWIAGGGDWERWGGRIVHTSQRQE